MSFGRSSQFSTAEGGEQGAVPALGQGTSNLQSGANFFQTLLSGNRANTQQLLQPDINRIRESTQGALQGASTLMPRGGGRFATLFQQPFQAQAQIGNLFSNMRSGAAQGLAGIGGQQAQIGLSSSQALANQEQQRQQMINKFISDMYGATTGAASNFFRAGQGAGGGGGG